VTTLQQGYVQNPDYWYENRHLLQSGMIFELEDGDVVQLDRPVPGDGTDWYVLDRTDGWGGRDGGWAAYDTRIHPTDLRQLLPSAPTH